MKATPKTWWHSIGSHCAALSELNPLQDWEARKVIKWLAWLLIACAAVGFQTAQSAAGDASGQGVQPMEVDGNPTCSDLLGIPDLQELKVEPVADGTYSDGDLTVMIEVQEGAKTFSWDQGDSSIIMQGVFVKGGPGGNLYEYYADGLLVSSDTGLHSPVGKNGRYAGLSHISFCYTPGAPEIKITKTCTYGGLEGGDTLRYNYKLIVENTGQLPLYDITATDTTAENVDLSGNSHVYPWGMLDVGDSQEFNGSFTVGQNGILNEAMVTAALVSGGTPSVTDDDSFDCPSQNIQGTLSLQKDCDVYVVNRFEETGMNEYGLKVKYSGSVCNTSDVTINGVIVQDNKDPEPHNIGTLTPKGTEGACADYNGSYEPVPGDGEGLPLAGEAVRAFTDQVNALGVTAFGGIVEAVPANASCTLCPACADLEQCPVDVVQF